MDPYDADAALEAIRPRMIAARARRRRAASVSAGVAMLAVSSVAAAAVMTPSDETQVVATSPDETSASDTTTTDTTTTTTEAVETVVPTTEPLEPPAPKPVETTPAPKPADTTPVPKPVETTQPPKPVETTQPPKPDPTTTTAPKHEPPPAESAQHTFAYPGTGTVTVEQTGDKLSFVGATAEPGWTKHLAYNQHDLVGVEFKKDNVQRWLKVKVIDGVAVAEQHESVSCIPPAGTDTHEAPSGAGSMTVAVDGQGKLSLVDTAPSQGWTAEVIKNEPDQVKVGFTDEENNFVWVRAHILDCAIKTQTG